MQISLNVDGSTGLIRLQSGTLGAPVLTEATLWGPSDPRARARLPPEGPAGEIRLWFRAVSHSPQCLSLEAEPGDGQLSPAEGTWPLPHSHGFHH